MDGLQITEQDDKNRQTNCRLGRSYRQNEKHKYLTRQILKVMRKGDEIHIHRKQHQFDSHQEDDQIFTVKKNSDDTDGEEKRAENQKMGQCKQDASRFLLHVKVHRAMAPNAQKRINIDSAVFPCCRSVLLFGRHLENTHAVSCLDENLIRRTNRLALTFAAQRQGGCRDDAYEQNNRCQLEGVNIVGE